ncbi:MAG: S8/S53 family peptidase, partial [Candidatus Promineifilaceae bacterium]
MQLPQFPRQLLQFLFIVLLVAALILVVMNELSWFFLLLFLLLLILLLWRLFGGREYVAPSDNYPPDEYYVQGQIILSGPETAVDAAVESASQTIVLSLGGTEEEQAQNKVRFSDLSEEVQNCIGECSGIDFDNFVIARYSFDDTEADVAAAIRAINDAVGRGSDVRAEPNWLSGHQWETSGLGWEPWEPTGSGEGAGEPSPAEFFMEQWAFKQIGLDQLEEHECGRNVRIGIFDTWPSGSEGLAVTTQSLSWVNQPTSLNLKSVEANYQLPPEKDINLNLSSHGLFTAGLAHAVAPNAEIHVYRVLNKNNMGDLFSLVKAVFDFILENTAEASEEQLGAVINLSLGIRVPPDAAQMALPLEVQALRDILRAARCAGIVVIAAAGNSSADLPSPKPADLPANWSEIIGVSSSTKGKGRSCFSNRGDLAAPGGDGGSKEGGASGCLPLNDTCNSPECVYGVIGPVLQNEGYPEGYAFWSGTSFSTPMVAGLAACVIEKGQGQLSPDQVRRIIECGVI